MAAVEYTAEQFCAIVDEEYEILGVPSRSTVYGMLNRWLERGDGAAVYQNHDLGHHELGHYQIVSYGSPAAQLGAESPPERLPDIGGHINWRYTLAGTYRGAPLPA
jgi:hypothetical protein